MNKEDLTRAQKMTEIEWRPVRDSNPRRKMAGIDEDVAFCKTANPKASRRRLANIKNSHEISFGFPKDSARR